MKKTVITSETSDTQQKPPAVTSAQTNFLMAKEKCEEAVRLCQEAQAEGAEPRQKLAEAQRACEEAVRECDKAMPQCETLSKQHDEAEGCLVIWGVIAFVIIFMLFHVVGCARLFLR